MFQNSGLSLEQAPPISVVLSLFTLGSLFGLLGGVTVTFFGTGADILNSSSISTIVLTHIFTIGVMANFMLGAIFQMLPVLASVVIQNPLKKAIGVQIGLTLGLFGLIIGFVWKALFLLIGGGVLITVFGFIAVVMLIGLSRVKTHTSSSKGMGFALLSLTTLLFFGAILILMRSGEINLAIDYLKLKELHFGFGLFGWITLLIIAVSFQVVEMFYVTEAFPKSFANLFGILVVILLTLKSILIFFSNNFYPLQLIADILLAISFFIYGVFAIKRVFNQKRRVIEATILFWRVGIISFLIFNLLWIVDSILQIPAVITVLPHHLFTFIGWFHILDGGMVITFSSFVFSILFAMVYKIVPFLVWFHLNAKGYFTAPLMHEVISPKQSRTHFYIHLFTILNGFIALVFPYFWHLVGMFLTISFGIVGFAIVKAWLKYNDVEKNGQRFDFGK